MEYTIEKKKAFKVIGFKRSFDTETAYDRIPAFWGEAMKKLCDPNSANHSLVEKCHICEYGVCVSRPNCKDFDYYIAGDYHDSTHQRADDGHHETSRGGGFGQFSVDRFELF